MKKIFEQIEREKNENEYNRTEIQDRSSMLNNTLQRFQFDLNQSGGIRIIDKTDSMVSPRSYTSQVRRTNQSHLSAVKHGLVNPNQLVYLQVRGRNQLQKEIEETQSLDIKIVENQALHRNELTHEIEGHDKIDP